MYKEQHQQAISLTKFTNGKQNITSRYIFTVLVAGGECVYQLIITKLINVYQYNEYLLNLCAYNQR